MTLKELNFIEDFSVNIEYDILINGEYLGLLPIITIINCYGNYRIERISFFRKEIRLIF